MTVNTLEYFKVFKPSFLTESFLAKYANQESPFSTDLGLVVFLRTYARFIPELKRREFWWETVARVVDYNMTLYKGPASHEALKAEAEELYDHVYNMKLFTSGRSLWTGGTEVVRKSGESTFNCSFKTIDTLEAFPEIFFLLMVGAGAGFSVERRYVEKLPQLATSFKVDHKPYQPVGKSMRIEFTEVSVSPNFTGMFTPVDNGASTVVIDNNTLVDINYQGVEAAIRSIGKNVKVVIKIGDSKEGWAGAVKAFLHALTCPEVTQYVFNYNYVRPENERLVTMGGRASGPGPLQKLFEKITWIVKKSGGRLSSVDCMDIGNSIAEITVVGGVRRSSEITLGDVNDRSFVEAKFGLWSGPNLEESQSEELMALLTEYGYEVDTNKLDADLAKKKEENQWLVGIPLDLIFNQFGGNHKFLWTGDFPEVEEYVDNHDPKYRFRSSRVMSNNSVHLWEKPSKEVLTEIFSFMENNGEPGIYIAENAAKRRPNYAGTNPCKPMCKAS